jgi:NAD(P)-dependent dehydrogenase (short-subunit alcohol dehydrogenase family)
VGRSMDGKVALVTGSGSGIGRESALAFSREGAKVVVADISAEGGAETARLITEAGGEATFMAVDVSDGEQVDEVVAKTVELYGSLDYAHNNAGIEGPAAEAHEYPLDEWNRILAINLTGIWHCMRAEIPVMRGQGKGAIVNGSSTFGIVGVPNLSGYVASKHAVIGLTKAAALENARTGVRVNAVCPWAIDTPMFERVLEEFAPEDPQAAHEAFAEEEPMGRVGRPAEIAEAVVWLCSDAASFVTGLPMPVDGGWLAQ